MSIAAQLVANGLIVELLEHCVGDIVCRKDELNVLEDREGKYTGLTTFDENGDVSGDFPAMPRMECGFPSEFKIFYFPVVNSRKP